MMSSNKCVGSVMVLFLTLVGTALAFTAPGSIRISHNGAAQSMMMTSMSMPNNNMRNRNSNRGRLIQNLLSRNKKQEMVTAITTSNTEMRSTASMDFMPQKGSTTNNIINKLQALAHKVTTLSQVTKWRIAATAFISTLAIFSKQLDKQLINVWSYLQHGNSLLPRMFRHDHWEWCLAVSAFFVWIHGWLLMDRAVAKGDREGYVSRFKKYRLQDQYEEEKFRRTQSRKLEELRKQQAHGGDNNDASLIEFEMNKKAPVVKQAKWHWKAYLFEVPLYMIPLYIWDICIPRRAARIATWSAPTTFGICTGVTSALLLYDFGFFICHYLMHRVPFLYKFVHKKHHTATEVRAADQVRLSGVEEVVDVGISILALRYLGVHPLARSIYNLIITFLLVELHCGFAMPWTPQFVVPFGLSTGSRGHHYHHRNGRHYYQKFFCTFDKLFGFVQKKDGSLQAASVHE